MPSRARCKRSSKSKALLRKPPPPDPPLPDPPPPPPALPNCASHAQNPITNHLPRSKGLKRTVFTRSMAGPKGSTTLT
ncbi:MAG: hypothetical protein AMJ65_09450 [Phycisphaerae bacterium SG8_4]|nr:MAG: hypothetical protein AMJ65_09450 [Phycisphaerae bacterium SG8_4]